MQVSNSTLILGASHLTTQGSRGIKLNTDEGLAYFERKQKLVNDAIKNNAQKSYKAFLEAELADINDDLTFLLEDEEMEKIYKMGEKTDDEEGWLLYRTLMDKYSTCKYFIKKLS